MDIVTNVIWIIIMKKNTLGNNMVFDCQFCGFPKWKGMKFEVECNVCGERKAACFYCWRYDYSRDNPKFMEKYENKCSICRDNDSRNKKECVVKRKFAVQLQCQFTQIIEAESVKEAVKEALRVAKENPHTAHAVVSFIGDARE